MVSPVSASPILQSTPIVDSIKEMEKVFDLLFKKYGIGKHGDNGKLDALEARLAVIEKHLGIVPAVAAVEAQKAEAVEAAID